MCVSQTHCTSIAPATHHYLSTIGLTRPARKLGLLKRASVCITHAGLNTVLEALAQGVPQVSIPVTNDQPGVGARIAAKKTGLVAPLKELTAPRLSRQVDEVLTDPLFRNNSRHLKKLLRRQTDFRWQLISLKSFRASSHPSRACAKTYSHRLRRDLS